MPQQTIKSRAAHERNRSFLTKNCQAKIDDVQFWTKDLPAELQGRDFSGTPHRSPVHFATLSADHVAFWHIPRTGGSSVAAGMFDAHEVPRALRPRRTIDSSEDCQLAVLRMLETREYPFFHLHHKDFTMAIALRRLGFKLCGARWLVHD